MVATPPVGLTKVNGNDKMPQPADSSHSRHGSILSVKTVASSHTTQSHQEYLDSLIAPSHEKMHQIAEAQDHKAEETLRKRTSMSDEHDKAAALIQRNYRGYRERRAMKGMGLDPTSRWVDAIREARYREYTQPKPRSSLDDPKYSSDGSHNNPNDPQAHKDAARKQWKKIGYIARRAVADEDSSTDESTGEESISEEQRTKKRIIREEKRRERQKTAKIMDLQYWLEAVDLKHRYGSNLRAYHQEWKKSNNPENFFYWLDYGEGKNINLPGASRTRLDSERVRYLSKEERLSYLVKIDKEGLLCWAKNGARIDTTVKFKDSIHGIVPADDVLSPRWAAPAEEAAPLTHEHRHSVSSDSSNETLESERAHRYATPELDKAKGYKKVRHVTAATIFNKLLRGSVRKNTWIFVADTSFRLYVGIKQSGAFQHSSFLHGSRISAAGLIKIKEGRLGKLSPLSGHYRPPVSSFRNFVYSLKDEGVDMSHVSISRSYAVLVGLEAYVKTRERGKRFIHALVHSRDKILLPEELKERQEAEMDRSESAAMKRQVLEEEKEKEKDNKANVNLLQTIHIRSSTPKPEANGLEKESGSLASGAEIIVPGRND